MKYMPKRKKKLKLNTEEKVFKAIDRMDITREDGYAILEKLRHGAYYMIGRGAA